MSTSTLDHNKDHAKLDDAVGIWLQAGFIEGIANDSRTFYSLEKALRHAFRNNRESAIMLWNGIPIQLDYLHDIPAIISPVANMITSLRDNEVLRNHEVSFTSKHIRTDWFIDADHKYIALCAEWYRVKGGYEHALNGFGSITVKKDSFINEWKLILGQCKQAISDSGSKFSTTKAKEDFSALDSAERSITSRGKYYINNE